MDLWNNLRDICSFSNKPWMLIGDFNDTMLPSEQRGSEFDQNRATIFAQNIDDCRLLCLDHVGACSLYLSQESWWSKRDS